MQLKIPIRHAVWAIPVLAAVAVYVNTLGAEFVWDDNVQIVNNPWVQELRHLPQAASSPVWAFKNTELTNYFRPIQMGAYNLLWVTSGGSPLAFHLANVLLHALVAAALALLVRRLGGDDRVALGTALLFAVHPVNTESVAWIACLPELSYTLLVLVALLLHITSWSADRRAARWWRVGAVAAFALAVFAKETALTAVVLIGLLELWVRHAAHPGLSLPARLWRAIRPCLPYVVAVLVYAAVRLAVVGGVAPMQRGHLTAWEALLNAPSLVFHYLRTMLFPVALQAYHIFEPIRTGSAPQFLVALVGLAAVVAAVFLLARRRPLFAFAGALALVPLLPVLYVPALGASPFAERYAYLPSAGVCWLVAGLVVLAADRLPAGRRRVATVAAVLAALALVGGVMSVARNRVWHDDERLARATLRVAPRALPMWALLSSVYARDDRFDDALSVIREALIRIPGDPRLRSTEVNLQYRTHAISAEEAVRRYERLLPEMPANDLLYARIGNAHLKAGEPSAAERAFREAIRLNPSSRPALDGLRLARIQHRAGDAPDETTAGPTGDWSHDPKDRLIDAAADLEAGRVEQAEAGFREALRSDPDSAEALLALGVIASMREDYAASIDYCRRAAKARPDFVDAWQQLGVSALQAGDGDTALEALERAVAINPNDKEIQSRLGVVYARAGRLDDARRAWMRALEIDPDFAKARHNLDRLDAITPTD